MDDATGHDYDMDDRDATWLFTDARLTALYGAMAQVAPSYHRAMGEFIARVCNGLAIPQLVCSTSTVYCHRLFTVRPLDDPKRWELATVCIIIAIEMDEYPYTTRDAIVGKAHVQYCSVVGASARKLDAFSADVDLLVMPVFSDLKFMGRVKHPYAYMITAAEALARPDWVRYIAREAWLLIRESYLTNASLRYRPSEMACAAVVAALKRLYSAPADDGVYVAWDDTFGAKRATIDNAAAFIERAIVPRM